MKKNKLTKQILKMFKIKILKRQLTTNLKFIILFNKIQN
jgi:hypothetical protein